jgi:hypothetical protein
MNWLTAGKRLAIGIPPNLRGDSAEFKTIAFGDAFINWLSSSASLFGEACYAYGY